jgi:hypothetical protein
MRRVNDLGASGVVRVGDVLRQAQLGIVEQRNEIREYQEPRGLKIYPDS